MSAFTDDVIYAQDGGQLSRTTDLVVSVQDVQDTAPHFLNQPYDARVFENATVVSQRLFVTQNTLRHIS